MNKKKILISNKFHHPKKHSQPFFTSINCLKTFNNNPTFFQLPPSTTSNHKTLPTTDSHPKICRIGGESINPRPPNQSNNTSLLDARPLLPLHRRLGWWGLWRPWPPGNPKKDDTRIPPGGFFCLFFLCKESLIFLGGFRMYAPKNRRCLNSTKQQKNTNKHITHLKFNIALEKFPSQKESNLPTIIFLGLC